MVVRSGFHAAKAAEIAFGLISANTLVHELHLVIDAVHIPTGVQRIPARAFVGMNSRQRFDMIAHQRHRIAFCAAQERQGTPATLTHDDNALALA